MHSISQGIRLLNDANSTLSIGYNLNALVFYQAGSAGPNGEAVQEKNEAAWIKK